MVARLLRGKPACCYCRCFRESHWRVVVQPRPLDVETSVPTTRIERTLALLSDSCEREREREAARRRVGCVRHKIRVPRRGAFPRRLTPTSSREFIASTKKRVSETFFRFEEPPDPSCDRFARWKIDRPRVSCWKLKRRCSRRLGFCLAFRPGRFSFGCIFQCVFVMPLIPFCQTSICRVTTFGCDGSRRRNFLLLIEKKSCRRDTTDYHEWAFVSRPSVYVSYFQQIMI